jgi:hypothetical protein
MKLSSYERLGSWLRVALGHFEAIGLAVLDGDDRLVATFGTVLRPERLAGGCYWSFAKSS